MFREWFFEYAGVDSSKYDLHLVNVGKGQEDVLSGGEYELQTDTLPRVPEQLLYGMNYSSAPLEFEVEICTDNKNIPVEQQIEIKNWLFGQDGWKTFTVIDETQKWHLKCVFIPNEDIMDGNGLRGFRCTLKNISPFWYGDVITNTIDKDTYDSIYDRCWACRTNNTKIGSMSVPTTRMIGTTTGGTEYGAGFKLNVPDDVVNVSYYPTISITYSNASASNIVETDIRQLKGDINFSSSTDNMISQIYFNTSENTVINCRYGTFSAGNTKAKLKSFKYPLLKFDKKDDVIYIYRLENITEIKISYQYLYRLGAF